METIHFRAMNTDVFLSAEGKPDQLDDDLADSLADGFEKAEQFVLESERRFTRFSEDSELSQLNRAGGTWFHASADMVSMLLLAQHFAGLTQGLFDPSILPDLQRAGYDQSMDILRAEGTIFSEPAVGARRPSTRGPGTRGPGARRHTPLTGMVIRPDEDLVYLPPEVMLDLGGIAKGWIAEQAANLLADFSPSCAVNAGGDMFLVGLPSGAKAWQVALEDPLKPGQVLTMLNVPPGAVATSSIAKRTWKQGEQLRHHLIDPRTGEPAVTDWLSVTVVSPHADTCEVFAKALLIAGPNEAETILNNEEEISYLAVDHDGKIWGTRRSMEYVYGN